MQNYLFCVNYYYYDLDIPILYDCLFSIGCCFFLLMCILFYSLKNFRCFFYANLFCIHTKKSSHQYISHIIFNFFAFSLYFHNLLLVFMLFRTHFHLKNLRIFVLHSSICVANLYRLEVTLVLSE